MQRFGLREQGNPLTQQHGRHLDNKMVDHIALTQGLQNGVSTHDPDVAIRSQLLHELRRVLGDGREALAVERVVSKDEVLGGGICQGRAIKLRDLGEGAATHQGDVHAPVKPERPDQLFV